MKDWIPFWFWFWFHLMVLVMLSHSISSNGPVQSPHDLDEHCMSDCSWTAYEASTQEEMSFQCSIASNIGYYSCPAMDTSLTRSVDERPKEVDELETEYYTMNISTDNGFPTYKICLRVQFTLDPSTASNIDGIEVSLLSRTYYTYGDMICRQFQFSGPLTYCSVLGGNCDHTQKRLFTTGCMCDLIPGGQYELMVTTLPEDELTIPPYSARVGSPLTVPDCSVFPMDQGCPRGLSVWRPSYSTSQQGADYTSMTTCFTLPPPEAEAFYLFLYSVQPHASISYSLVRDSLQNQSGVTKQSETINSKQVQLACVSFSGLLTNMTYLPALRLELKDSTNDPPRLQYLDKSQLFLIDNPCDVKPCGEGTCVPYGPVHECICNKGAIYDGSRCTIDVQDPLVLNCPSIMERPSEPGKCSAAVTWPQVNASDNSVENRLIYQSHQSGSLFPVGDTMVEYSFSDVANNTGSCVFRVSILDEEAPFVEPCDQSLRAALKGGKTHVRVSWNIIAEDNCGGVTSDTPLSSSQLFAVGVTEIPITVRDESGNEQHCGISVKVDAAPFNILRPIYIIGALLVLAGIIAAVFWRYRDRLKELKAFLKTYHPPYSIPGEGTHPGPSLHDVSQIASREAHVYGWLSQQQMAASSSIPGTLSHEDVISAHLQFEPAILIRQEQAYLLEGDKAGRTEGSFDEEDTENSQESDNLVGSSFSTSGMDSDIVNSKL